MKGRICHSALTIGFRDDEEQWPDVAKMVDKDLYLYFLTKLKEKLV